jgi:hypothetical protein
MKIYCDEQHRIAEDVRSSSPTQKRTFWITSRILSTYITDFEGGTDEQIID